MKKRNLMGLLAVGFAAALFIGGKDASAEKLTSAIDLKGADSVIVTVGNQNYLKNKNGSYELDEKSVIYSSKQLMLTLSNYIPVQVDSINVKADLDVRGNGHLIAKTTSSPFAINVGDDFQAFLRSGNGKITAIGNEIGIRVQEEINMKAGSIEGTGREYGIWCYNDIKPYDAATVVGKATNGIGIWTYNDVFAWKGATVRGEGKKGGVRTVVGLVSAEASGSSVTGVLTDINSQFSAVHADKKELRASNMGRIHEIYLNAPFEITFDEPVFVTDFSTVKRNLRHMRNYEWTSNPDNVKLSNSGGLVGDKDKLALLPPTIEFPKNMDIYGVRVAATSTSWNKGVIGEPTQLKTAGVHIVQFGAVPVDFTTTYKITHNIYSGNTLIGTFHTIEKVPYNKTVSVRNGLAYVPAGSDNELYSSNIGLSDVVAKEDMDVVLDYTGNVVPTKAELIAAGKVVPE